jgi:ABC-2 type transport system ATP-binding protein
MQPTPLIDVRGLGRRYGATVALNSIDWSPRAGSAVGLLGRNGAGKTTLLQTVVGLTLPSSGSCRTLGVPVAQLDAPQLSRIGYVDQEGQLLGWLSVEQHVRYVASFHDQWDETLEDRLRVALELDGKARVGTLSPGMRQRLALLLAVCHRPTLLLLDEPVSALDPVARVEALRLILNRVIDDGATVVVSSHVLHDVEKIIDHVLCLENGNVVEDTPLDDLKERYAEWIVTSSGADVPELLNEPFVLSREGSGRRVRLAVSATDSERAAFATQHDVQIEQRPLDLAHIFPLISTGGRS